MSAGRWIALGLAAALLYGGAVVVLHESRWRPERRELAALREWEETAARELRGARAVAATRAAAEAASRGLDDELEKLAQVLPERLAPGEVTARVRDAAAEQGIRLLAAGSERRTDRDFYSEVAVSVAFAGPVAEAEALQDAIAEGEPLARLTALHWEPPEEREAAVPPSWTVTVTAYQAEPSGPEPPPTDAPTAGG